MAMVGVIQVGDSKANLESVKSAATQLESMFVMNKERLTNYLNQL